MTDSNKGDLLRVDFRWQPKPGVVEGLTDIELIREIRDSETSIKQRVIEALRSTMSVPHLYRLMNAGKIPEQEARLLAWKYVTLLESAALQYRRVFQLDPVPIHQKVTIVRGDSSLPVAAATAVKLTKSTSITEKPPETTAPQQASISSLYLNELDDEE